MKLDPIVSMLWQQLFGVIQLLDPVVDTAARPIWRINDDESKMLGNATTTYLKSLPKNRRSNLQKFIDKHAPLIALTGTAAIVVQPRLAYSIQVKRGTSGSKNPIDLAVERARRAQQEAARAQEASRAAASQHAGTGVDVDAVDAAFASFGDDA